MTFGLYIIGYLIFIGGVVWGCIVAGVPQLYVAIGATILIGIGVFTGAARTRGKDPS